MIKSQIQQLEICFTDSIPIEITSGILYISMEYGLAKHKCPCGCGLTVITPIHPSRWHLFFDGESITLSPSIGNYQFCGSHYFIRKNKIMWAYQKKDFNKSESSIITKLSNKRRKKKKNY